MPKSFYRTLLLAKVHEEQNAFKRFLEVSSGPVVERFADEYALRENIVRILEKDNCMSTLQLFALLVYPCGTLARISDLLLHYLDHENLNDEDFIMDCILAMADGCLDALHDMIDDE